MSHFDAVANLGMAFLKDFGLEASDGESNKAFGSASFNTRQLDYHKVNPIRGVVASYLDYDVGSQYKGTSIDDWVNMDINLRDIMIDELGHFDVRKKAAIAAAKKAAEEEAKREQSGKK